MGQEILLQAAVPCAEATAAHSASTSTLAAAACMVERGVAEDVGGPQWRAAAEAAEEREEGEGGEGGRKRRREGARQVHLGGACGSSKPLRRARLSQAAREQLKTAAHELLSLRETQTGKPWKRRKQEAGRNLKKRKALPSAPLLLLPLSFNRNAAQTALSD